MGKRISSQTRKELLDAMRRFYRASSKMDKTKILDELVAFTGYHRKHGVRLLWQACDTEAQAYQDTYVCSRRVYDEAVKETLTVLWEASDRICGKRLSEPGNALMMAKNGAIAALLISHGADVNPLGQTSPLHQAAVRGKKDVTEALLSNGTDTEARDRNQARNGNLPRYRA